MQQASLCFLIRENQGEKELLLAMKKKGFGVGKWNGVGGKFDINKGDKHIFDTAVRETREETGIEVKNIKKSAILNFYFPYQKEWNQEVHVFISKNWKGKPKESEEMKPKWFKINKIPFEKMWSDDKFWLQRVLTGEKLKADFIFKEGESISSYDIKVINRLD